MAVAEAAAEVAAVTEIAAAVAARSPATRRAAAAAKGDGAGGPYRPYKPSKPYEAYEPYEKIKSLILNLNSQLNTFGRIFRLTTFGESHGAGLGGVIDGMPPRIPVDVDFIQWQLDRRRPGQSGLTTSRNEDDRVEILSGVFDGLSTGQPIGFLVRNRNQHSSDYENLRDVFRPSHADYTYYAKWGIRDYKGSGRSSARETLSRVVGGAFAMLCLRQMGITVEAYTSQVGNVRLEGSYKDYDLSLREENDVRCPDAETARRMADLIMQVKGEGDTIGGIVTCVVKGLPVGLGEPTFDKLHAQLAAAMLSINAAKGFDYGRGFDGVEERGSEQNDIPMPSSTLEDGGKLSFRSNNSGGIQGGISNGQDVYFRVAFKPVATLLREQPTVDIHGNATTVKVRGRHDACVLPRAVPVVEAMAAMTIMDNILQNKIWQN